jgi:aminoglycoside phosphotransferase
MTETQRRALSELLRWALLEIRQLSASGKAQQTADLADAFHNVPAGIWSEDFSLQRFRDQYLAAYQKKYPGPRPKDYVASIDEIIAAGS